MRAVSLISIVAFAFACGGGAPPCTNTCASPGSTQCSGALVQTCAADANGCLAWGAGAACASGQSCLAGVCAAVDPCANPSVQSACAQASAHVNSCCGGTAAAKSGAQICKTQVEAGKDPATVCGTINGTSCSDMHNQALAAGVCCCPSGQSCDPSASNACVPRCTTNADCANVPGRTACAPTIGLVKGSEAVAGPYICVPDDGQPGHGCNAPTCSGTNVCARDSRGNAFCTTPCTGDTSCANNGVACCNVSRTFNGTPACGLCGSP
jgi:hypothetical protein